MPYNINYSKAILKANGEQLHKLATLHTKKNPLGFSIAESDIANVIDSIQSMHNLISQLMKPDQNKEDLDKAKKYFKKNEIDKNSIQKIIYSFPETHRDTAKNILRNITANFNETKKQLLLQINTLVQSPPIEKNKEEDAILPDIINTRPRGKTF